MTYFFSILSVLLLCLYCHKPQKENVPAHNRELKLSFKYNPLTIDPRKNSDPVSCALINMLYEGLTHLESDGSISLGLASSINVSENNTLYTFHLKDAYWSNGKPITSYDVEYSWKKMLSPNFHCINAYFLYPIKHARQIKLGITSLDRLGIYIEDDKTFSLKLEHPNPHFLKMLSFVSCFPIWKETDNADHPEMAFSGPFVLQEWHADNFLVLKKNPFFWNASKVHLESIYISIVPDENTSFKLYESRAIDCLGSLFSPIPLEELPMISKHHLATTQAYAGTTMCFFNIRCFPFDNLNIRKAFSYAINKKDIIDNICQNHEIQAYGIIPPMLKKQKEIKCIPDGSKELAKHHFTLGLKECGIAASELPQLTFSVYSSVLEKTIALALQQQWKEVLGVDVALECLDVKIFLDKLYKKNYQFSLMSILAQYFDPMNFLERFISSDGPKNFCSWEDSSFKQLLESSSDTSSEEDRLLLLEKAEELLMHEAPVAPIYHHTITYTQHEELEGMSMTPVGLLDFRYAYFK
jgi:oligopeptide transport system substrate-binding protein